MTKGRKQITEQNMTVRLALVVVLVFIITAGLVALVSQIGGRGSDVTKVAETSAIEGSSVIVGDHGITKTSCEAAHGFWVECGNPCYGSDSTLCVQVCEPQCLCGGSEAWECPGSFSCTDYTKLASDEKEVGVCRYGEAKEQEQSATEVVPTAPVRETPSGMICDDLNFICVDEAVSGTELASPFEVSGSGIAFENTINWRLLDGRGAILGEGHATTNAPDVGKPGAFNIRAFILNVPTTKAGTLEVFEYSAKDGSQTHMVSLPVQLPQDTMTVTNYLLPEPLSGDLTGVICTDVQAIETTVVRSQLPIETTLRTLLADPSASSAIPQGTLLQDISVSNGTAHVIFSQELESGGGSCAAQAIRAQIEKTLEHFSSVKQVEISVVGKSSDETLQP